MPALTNRTTLIFSDSDSDSDLEDDESMPDLRPRSEFFQDSDSDSDSDDDMPALQPRDDPIPDSELDDDDDDDATLPVPATETATQHQQDLASWRRLFDHRPGATLPPAEPDESDTPEPTLPR